VGPVEPAPPAASQSFGPFCQPLLVGQNDQCKDVAFLTWATMLNLLVLLVALTIGFGVGATITINRAPAFTNDSRNWYYFAEEPAMALKPAKHPAPSAELLRA
jgi:hypothetical protein